MPMTEIAFPEPMVWAVFAPLIGAMAAFVLPRLAPWIGLATVAITAVAVVRLGHDLVVLGPRGLELGGWSAPLGIALRADGLAVTMLAMTAGVGLLVSLAALHSYPVGPEGSQAERMRRYFWPLWLLLLCGTNGAYLSADLFNLYVMIEVIALAAVGLTVLSGTRAALRAGLDYMFASILGALLFLLGVGLVYLQLGRLDLPGIGAADPAPTLVAALAAMVIGLALKTALFPLHVWLPRAHANATAPASALLSGLVIKVSLYIVLRLSQHLTVPSEALMLILGLMGTGAILWGSVQALRAERLKQMVAWSTVSQIGLIVLAFARAGQDGTAESWRAAALLMLAHAVAKSAMFLAAGRIRAEVGHDRIADLDRSPVRPTLAHFAFALAAISLIGLPPSIGFAGKWVLMEGALAAGYWHWVVVAMLGTMLSVAYYSRVFASFLRFDRARGPLREHQGWAAADVAPLALAAAAAGLGLFVAPILSFLAVGAPVGAMP